MAFPNGVVPTTETCVQWGSTADCRVHPAPLYELLIWSAIGWLLWRLGARILKNPKRAGEIFCYYLILTGVARFLVEIIRINPPWILGLSNAQVASAVSAIGGLILLVFLKRSTTASS
jgi:phosphatidylglycerol:prolipoprotein diacylglycerol transferase